MPYSPLSSPHPTAPLAILTSCVSSRVASWPKSAILLLPFDYGLALYGSQNARAASRALRQVANRSSAPKGEPRHSGRRTAGLPRPRLTDGSLAIPASSRAVPRVRVISSTFEVWQEKIGRLPDDRGMDLRPMRSPRMARSDCRTCCISSGRAVQRWTGWAMIPWLEPPPMS